MMTPYCARVPPPLGAVAGVRAPAPGHRHGRSRWGFWGRRGSSVTEGDDEADAAEAWAALAAGTAAALQQLPRAQTDAALRVLAGRLAALHADVVGGREVAMLSEGAQLVGAPESLEGSTGVMEFLNTLRSAPPLKKRQ